MTTVTAEAARQVEDLPWGERTADLQLATGSYLFSSISNRQAETLERRYRPFALAPPTTEVPVLCEVSRLIKPMAPNPQMLTWAGQYALKLDRSASGMAITGANFRAYVEWGHPVASSLQVHQEAELTYPNVIENYLRVLAAYQTLSAGGLLLHSAGILVGGEARVFPGPSGAGKTTLARKARGAGCAILSDDICLLRPDAQQGYVVLPVPFAGELGTSLDAITGDGYRLGGIHLLVQGSRPAHKPLAIAAAVAHLTASCPFVNTDPDRIPALLAVASALAERRAVHELTLDRDTPFEVVRELIEDLGHA